VRLLKHFASRACLDIESLGDIVAEKLIERGPVEGPLDLFELKLADLALLNLGTESEPRVFGPKNAEKLLAALNRARSMPLQRWLYAFGIPGIGKTTAIGIAAAHDDLKDLADSKVIPQLLEFLNTQSECINAIKQQNREARAATTSEKNKAKIARRVAELNAQIQQAAATLLEIGLLKVSTRKKLVRGLEQEFITRDIGPEAALRLIAFFSSEQGQATLRRLDELGINPTSAPTSSGNALAGRTFVLTGTLSLMTRDRAATAIRAQGGNVASSISGKTDYLVAGANTGARKMERAAELNVAIMDEEGFLKLLRDQPSQRPLRDALPPQPPGQLDLFS